MNQLSTFKVAVYSVLSYCTHSEKGNRRKLLVLSNKFHQLQIQYTPGPHCYQIHFSDLTLNTSCSYNRSGFPLLFVPLENTLHPVTPLTRPPQPLLLLYINTLCGHTLHQLFGSSAPPPFPGSNRAANELGGAVPGAFPLHMLFQNKQLQPSARATSSQIKGTLGCATGWNE